MNKKNIIFIILIISGGALFLVLQKYSREHYASSDQPKTPDASISTPRHSAPDFTLIDLEGNNFKLSYSRGKVIVMMFWTTW